MHQTFSLEYLLRLYMIKIAWMSAYVHQFKDIHSALSLFFNIVAEVSLYSKCLLVRKVFGDRNRPMRSKLFIICEGQVLVRHPTTPWKKRYKFLLCGILIYIFSTVIVFQMTQYATNSHALSCSPPQSLAYRLVVIRAVLAVMLVFPKELLSS